MTNESTLRALVRSLLRESASYSFLAPGVTPEMFAESYRNFWGPSFCKPAIGTSPEVDTERAKILSHCGLNEEEVQGFLELVDLCSDRSNMPPYRADQVAMLVGEVLGLKKREKMRIASIVNGVIGQLTESDDSKAINFISSGSLLHWFWQGGDIDYNYKSFPKAVAELRNTSKELLVQRNNFMESTTAWHERKDLDIETRAKLVEILKSGIDGVFQAAELYRML